MPAARECLKKKEDRSKDTEGDERIFPLAKAGYEFLFFVSKISFHTV